MNNELQEHKTSDKIKWILTLIAFIAVGVMLVGIILGWFEKKDKPEQQDDNQIVVTPQQSQTAIRLNATRAVASGNTYTLNAEITPSDATDKSVTWTAAWSNPSSNWASGKSVSSYITLTPDDLTATVTLKAAFGERVIITVTSDVNETATASCTVDYVERLNIPHGNAYMDVDRIYQNMTTDRTFAFGTTMNIKADVKYAGVGTVRGDLEFGQLKIGISDGMRDYITGQVSGYNYSYTTKTNTYDFSGGINTTVNISAPTGLFSFMGNPTETSGKLTNAFIAACKAGYTVRVTSTFTYSYDGTVLQSGDVIGDFTVNTNGLAITATSVGLDSSGIAF